MLLADAQPETWVQVVAIVAVAVVTAWSSVRVRQIDRQARKERKLSRVERQRCDAMEKRVGELEAALTSYAKLRRRRPGKPPKTP